MQAVVALGKLAQVADSLPPQASSEMYRRLLSLEELMRREMERQAEQAKSARPIFLKLVVNNDDEARP